MIECWFYFLLLKVKSKLSISQIYSVNELQQGPNKYLVNDGQNAEL